MPAACRNTVIALSVRCSLHHFVSGKEPSDFREVINSIGGYKDAPETKNKCVNAVTAENESHSATRPKTAV